MGWRNISIFIHVALSMGWRNISIFIRVALSVGWYNKKHPTLQDILHCRSIILKKAGETLINNFWYLINDLVNSDAPFVVATLFGKSGSAPRTDGTKMIIYADGSISGTIGGGLLETRVRELAAQVFLSKISQINHFDFSAGEIAETDMICGGRCEVLLDYIEASNPAQMEVYNGAVNALNKREAAWLVTAISPDNSGPTDINKCLAGINSSITGRRECSSEVLQQMVDRTSELSVYVFDKRRFLVEPIYDREWLYIFGAGHIARQLAVLAEMADFKTVVADDRLEYANRERFPHSDIFVLDSFETLSATLDIRPQSYLVIVTRGHVHDKTVLEQLLKIPSAYVGMIASRRKRQLIYDALQTEQGFTAQDLARVHSPIGIEIMAETPEEIAISIVAELIKVRAERKQCSQILRL